jgi:hypothetical protein
VCCAVFSKKVPARVCVASAVVILIAAAGCGSNPSIFQTPATPTPSPPPIVPVNLVIDPYGVNGGVSARVTATLSQAAPSGGTLLTLASRDAAAIVPPSVTIPEGLLTFDFTVATQPVPDDRHATIVATTGGKSVSVDLEVWGDVPTFFFWTRPASPFISGSYGRVSPANASFSAHCRANEVRVSIDEAQGNSSVWMAAPTGSALRPGTYENATRAGVGVGNRQPALDVSIRNYGCNLLTGRFVVKVADLAPTGEVRSFWATFEQRCDGSAPELLTGEIRLAGPVTTSLGGGSCLQ